MRRKNKSKKWNPNDDYVKGAVATYLREGGLITFIETSDKGINFRISESKAVDEFLMNQ